MPGKPLRDALLAQIPGVLEAHNLIPRLVIVQVGNNPASSTYIANKLKACAQVGINAEVVHLAPEEGEATFTLTVRSIAAEPEVDAMIVQTPLPEGWDMQAALDLVPPEKDIDGLSTANINLRHQGNPKALWPATPLGIVRMLSHAGLTLAGQTVAVVGRGRVVGLPLQDILHSLGAHVVAIDRNTLNPAQLAHQANVLISAAGAPGLITKAWVKPGATVVDVGLTRGADGKLVGDVNRAEVEGIAAILTPSPGGVGPLTVASLLTNIVDAACQNRGLPRPVWHIPSLT
jgi:methylenetetrahydrofolate dehydrogenase (NADP+)/methenyltetrahydrofolate cyclohydrolase